METFVRRLEILRYLDQTREPRSTTEIIRHLIDVELLSGEEGAASATLRMVQRDLSFLLGGKALDEDDEPLNEFGLRVVRGEGKSLLWQLDPLGRLRFDFQQMPQYLAVAFAMTSRHLKHLLPANVAHELERFFLVADERLAKAEQSMSPRRYTMLANSIAFHQRGMPMRPPEFDFTILDQIYSAIVKGRQLKMSYKGKRYFLHPYGIAILLPKYYLVARKEGDGEDELRTFLLHRIDELEISRFSSSVPADFDIRNFLLDGRMELFVDPEIQDTLAIVLEIDLRQTGAGLIDDLRENPISDHQHIQLVNDSGTFRIEFESRYTIQLRNWIVSLGPGVSVCEPGLIKKDITDYLAATLRSHSN